MQGELATTCPACGQAVTWIKIMWTRPDGYPDWDLDVRCGCGKIEDELIVRQAFEAYHVQLRAMVRAGQNTLIDSVMGQGANAALEALCREHGKI